jgi:hypothetical protein
MQGARASSARRSATARLSVFTYDYNFGVKSYSVFAPTRSKAGGRPTLTVYGFGRRLALTPGGRALLVVRGRVFVFTAP